MAILVAALGLTMYLPLATRWTIASFEQHAKMRAESTPLVIGAKGSRFSLVLHALYFRGEPLPAIQYAQLQRVEESDLANAIPLHGRFFARGVPIIGTTGRYFQFRQLTVEHGQGLQRLGDCVVGATAARRLEIRPGDRLLSEPENMFDVSGPTPLNLRVTGLLAANGTADDDVVWCDLKTSWIIDGIGHGHSPATQTTSSDFENSDNEGHQHSASGQYLQVYQEVTDENLQSFHFHGKRGEYPLTAIIAIPDSERSATLLQGRYLGVDEVHQIVRPPDVVQELVQVIGRVRGLFDLGIAMLTTATAMLVCLVLSLSIRLRQREIRTMNLLGCSRGTILRIVTIEWTILLFVSMTIALALAALTARLSESFFVQLL